MADDAWMKGFPHPSAIFVWDAAAEKWIPAPSTIPVSLTEPVSVSFFDARVAVTDFPDDTVWSGLVDNLNEAVTAEPGGLATFGVNIIELTNWIGTLVFEVSSNGVAYVGCPAVDSSTGEVVTSVTGSGTFVLPCAGYMRIRVRVSEWTAGSALVTLRGSVSPNVGLPLTNTQLRGSPVPVQVTSVEEQLKLIRRILEEILIFMKEKT